jgi:23S rRNA (cytosine1962-C5)-methyltransferase
MERVILAKGRDKSVINKHPWIFSGGIAQMPNAENGDVVQVCDFKLKPLALGFFSTKSQISVRLFEFVELDSIPEDYWDKKVQNAFNLRQQLLPKDTNCYRLLHAEGDFLPGIIADVYDEVLVLQVLIKGIERILTKLIRTFNQLGFQNIYLKNKELSNNIEGVNLENKWLSGNPIPNPKVLEHGVPFSVDVINGQKTGFFLDQRPNRLWLGSLSAGKKVLNTFSYTGGFSMYALANGASEVVSVDISKDAINQANLNSESLELSAKHTGVAADCFDYIKNCSDDFDIIVLDPPAFAKHKNAVNNAARGYKELNLQALRKVKPGGLVFTFSCSQHISSDLFRKIVFAAAADSGRNVRILNLLSQGQDHPINIYHPEGEYLKGLILQVE